MMTFASSFLENGPEDEYDGWNFTDNRKWDALTNESFWYNPNNQIIVNSNYFEIGRTQLQQAKLTLQPQKFTFQD